QAHSGLDAPAIVPARAAARRHLADLRRHEPQAPAVEGRAQLGRNRFVAVPAHLDDGALQARAFDGGAYAPRAGARMDDAFGTGPPARRIQARAPAPQRLPWRARGPQPSPPAPPSGPAGRAARVVTTGPLAPPPPPPVRSPAHAPPPKGPWGALPLLAKSFHRR